MKYEKYIGLKYKDRGRDFDGVDCWGLVRLIYKTEHGIELPSFSSEYVQSDTQRIEELLNQQKEAWESNTLPDEGSVVLFRILGSESHVGYVIGPDTFIHVRENQDSVIESLSHTKWKNRIVGFYKYSPKKCGVINAIPHPLKTERYTIPVPPGTKLSTLVYGIAKEYKVSEKLIDNIVILLNSEVIPKEQWDSVSIKDGDAIEYRALPRGDVIRTLAIIVIAYYAPIIAGELTGYTAAASAAATMGAEVTASLTAMNAVATAAVMIAGSAIVNAIAPIRPPSMGGNDPGSAERQIMLDGGTNTADPYGAIPVVLGKVRITPRLGAVNYLTYENERDSYLSMLLVWGYGPLYLDAATIRIGDIPLTNYPVHQLITLDRIIEPTITEETAFNALYGNDITQVGISTELVCDGSPDIYPRQYSGTITNEYDSSTDTYTPVLGIEFDGTKTGAIVEATFTSTTANWSHMYTDGLTDIVITIINSTTRKITAKTTRDGYPITIFGIIFKSLGQVFGSNGSPYIKFYTNSGSYTGKAYGLTPGPWIQGASDEVVDSYTIALHFPQGIRKIGIQGDVAGNSYPAPVQVEVEYSVDGGTNWLSQEILTVGKGTAKKDAFTYTKTYSFSNRPNGMVVRARRITGDNIEDNPNYRYYFTTIFQSVTFTRNARPAVDPLNAKIAKSALKIKATDQLNGRIDGINGIVQTWCKTWNGTTWVNGTSNNPAALFRYVLEHPANPKKVTNAATQIDLVKLQYFYEYCVAKGFTYNSVLGAARSILDVLRDICAAGRASPALVDGKWTVIIDEPKSNIIQHFSPHNSWGFEGTKALPRKPDGLRVTYFDEDNNYQEAEIIVYDVNKDETTAELFESITLPGVTKKDLVIDHAKWHFAQFKLRPEVYTLNVDIEYLVCNRGDRVKVTHDIPMWGLGSGRVKQVLSSTKLLLDEALPMKAGTTYTIRIRTETGESISATVLAKISDGQYDTIDITNKSPNLSIMPGDLFLFGEINKESQDLIVLSIEPNNAKSARLTLVDYGVTSSYNIFTDYKNLTSSIVFESQITLPPSLQQDSFGTKVPEITGFVSDESVMERLTGGMFRYSIAVAFVNAPQLPIDSETVEIQYDLLDSEDTLNARSVYVNYQLGSVRLLDVEEGLTYKIRARYISRLGRFGLWSDYVTHTVVGKINPPQTVAGLKLTVDKVSSNLILSWNRNPEVDVVGYEVRTQDADWGVNNSSRIFYGDATSCSTKPLLNGQILTLYVKAYDYSGNFSVSSVYVQHQLSGVSDVGEFTYTFSDTALTNANVTLSWNEPLSEFAIAGYEISYGTEVIFVKATTITLPANWIGNRTYTIKTVDILGKKSTGYSQTVAKFLPGVPTGFRAQVVDNTVMLYWTLPVKTSLPIDHVTLKRGTTWETATLLGDKKGEFTTVNESQGGLYTYWLAAVDTDNNMGIPISITATVAEPPDFVFHGDFDSAFDKTKVSAVYDNGKIILPVKTNETWQQHFVNNGWTTLQSQVSAGYPVYLQPTTGSGYYEEVFDFGSVLASSKVTLSYRGTVISGTPLVVPRISLSETGSTYYDYDGATDVYGLNFRYVKVRITVTESDTKGAYSLEYLNVRLDAKLKNDAGNIYANSTDTLGTITNFNKEFIDPQSIVLSAAGTIPATPVYDFKGELPLTLANYTVSAGTCTIAINSHGLIAGQKIKVQISAGIAVTGQYIISSVTTNTISIAMPTANTSGTCTIYPQSFRMYLFDISGNRMSGTVSWSIKGY